MARTQSEQDIENKLISRRNAADAEEAKALKKHEDDCDAMEKNTSESITMGSMIACVSTCVTILAGFKSDWLRDAALKMARLDTPSLMVACVCFAVSIFTNYNYPTNESTRLHTRSKTMIALFVSLLMLMLNLEISYYGIVGLAGAIYPTCVWGTNPWMRPDVFALVSDTGPVCQLKNNLAEPYSMGRLKDQQSCMVEGAFKAVPSLKEKENEEVLTLLTCMAVSVDIQRCFAYSYAAWIMGWLIVLNMNLGVDESKQDGFQRMELVCASAVFFCKAVLCQLDFIFFVLEPNSMMRLQYYEAHPLLFKPARIFLGDPLIICVAVVFMLRVLK